MISDILKPKEKKVEYVELIYDLIFVYVIGRNNLLLHNFSNGFVALPAFLAYIMIKHWQTEVHKMAYRDLKHKDPGGIPSGVQSGDDPILFKAVSYAYSFRRFRS